MGASGSFVLVLHSHIPYVLRHNPMEEEMLLEAVAESYVPLLACFERLVAEGVSPRATVGISPCLAEQLADPYFKQRFRGYCLDKATWAVRDAREFEPHNAHMAWLARRWEAFYAQTYQAFVNAYGEDLVGAFRRLQDAGHIELMTCAATHAYFPIMLTDATIRAQVQTAVKAHTRHFGRAPKGFWLPECGYRPGYWWRPPFTSRAAAPPTPRAGVDEILADSGIGYFIVDGHQLAKSWPPDLPKNPFETYLTGGENGRAPLTVLTRDVGLSLQVWRHQVGYPGDGTYLDFHKRHADGRLRYWKITHADLDMAHKDLYYPDDAERFREPEHAGHFKWLVAQSLKHHAACTGRPGVALTAFDTELFGHWWFEGPQWLYHVLKWIDADPELTLATCDEVRQRTPGFLRIGVAESSWGNHFDHSTWVNRDVEWVWEHIYHTEHELSCLGREFANGRADDTLGRILRQAARQAFLLMASDWQFMIANWCTRDLAERRVHEHHADFERLARIAWDYGHGRQVPEADWTFLAESENRDRLFPGLDVDALSE